MSTLSALEDGLTRVGDCVEPPQKLDPDEGLGDSLQACRTREARGQREGNRPVTQGRDGVRNTLGGVARWDKTDEDWNGEKISSPCLVTKRASVGMRGPSGKYHHRSHAADANQCRDVRGSLCSGRLMLRSCPILESPKKQIFALSLQHPGAQWG